MIIKMVPALLPGFIIVHAIKLMRLYLIMVEDDIPFSRFVFAYFRTTLVNLIIPYKLGEVYRIAAFSHVSGKIKNGFFAVLVDRFFDTLAIVFILFPYQLFIKGEVSLPVLMLFAFVMCVLFTYIVFPSTYSFLNRYIIVKRNSSKSLAALNVLEVLNGWYEYVKKLVTGRYGMLVLFSFAAWIGEILILAGFNKMSGSNFSVESFGRYIESIISGGNYNLKREYTLITIWIIAAATVVTLLIYLAGKIKKKVRS